MENSKASETPKTNIKELLVNNFAFLGLILVLVLFEILTGGKLLGQRNLMNIFNNFFSIALCSMMYTFVMALGELDLSVGAIVGFSAAMGAFSATISPALILPVALLTGTGIGLLSGFATAYLRVESFIGTLAISFIFRGLTTYFLNGSVGIPISMGKDSYNDNCSCCIRNIVSEMCIRKELPGGWSFQGSGKTIWS